MPQMETTRRRSTQRTRLEVTSTAFQEGESIPTQHAADGEDVSPPLRWSNPPAATRSFALLCEDPDAPAGPFMHWLVWNIPANQRELPAAVPPTEEANGTHQGENSFGKVGYAGPKPPPKEEHRYLFRVYALDCELNLPTQTSHADFQDALQGHVLAEGVLSGKYGW